MTDGKNLLLACLWQESEKLKISRLRGLSEEEWEILLAEASRHGLVPFIFKTVKPYYPDPHIQIHFQDKMRRVYYQSAARNMRLFRQLGKVLKKFSIAGIPAIVLKGAHLAGYVYDNIALRPMYDIDLLIMEEDLGSVHRLLIKDGYSNAKEGNPSYSKHLAPYEKKDHIPLEIHFHIADPPLAERIDLSALWKRSEKRFLEQAEISIYCPEDLFLYLCLHTCIQHVFNNGLIACIDVAQIIEHDRVKINWEQLWSRAGEWRIERAVYLMLALTERITGLPIPEQIDRKMQFSEEIIEALAVAEELIHEEEEGTSRYLTRLFEKQSWRKKLSYLKQRAFLSGKSNYIESQQTMGIKPFQQYQPYLLRLLKLFKAHRKTIWLGLRGDPQTVNAIEIQKRKNRLRDWLTHTGEN